MNSAAYHEAALYHQHQNTRQFVAIFQQGQTCVPAGRLADTLAALPDDSEVLVSQAGFYRPSRRLVHLASIGVCFTDLETHKSRLADLTPEQQAKAILLFCDDAGLPRPSLINHSGRGLHTKWLLDTPLPAEALPRWNAVQRALGAGLEGFHADRAARDASRCLRAVGSLNPRSGQRARTVWIDEHDGEVARWDFETLAQETLPLTRGELEKQRTERKAKTERVKAGSSNYWSARELWWWRLADVRKLIGLRGWQDGVPQGYRNNFLFVATCAVAWGVEAGNLEAEVQALAAEFCPTLSPSEVWSSTRGVIARAQQDTPYRLTTARLLELLDVQRNEQPFLKTLIDADERRERDRQRHRKNCDRATYESLARQRREQAQSLRATGLTYAAIAQQMGCTVNSIDRLMRTP